MKRKYYENPSITVVQLTDEDVVRTSININGNTNAGFNDNGAIELPCVPFN